MYYYYINHTSVINKRNLEHKILPLIKIENPEFYIDPVLRTLYILIDNAEEAKLLDSLAHTNNLHSEEDL